MMASNSSPPMTGQPPLKTMMVTVLGTMSTSVPTHHRVHRSTRTDVPLGSRRMRTTTAWAICSTIARTPRRVKRWTRTDARIRRKTTTAMVSPTTLTCALQPRAVKPCCPMGVLPVKLTGTGTASLIQLMCVQTHHRIGCGLTYKAALGPNRIPTATVSPTALMCVRGRWRTLPSTQMDAVLLKATATMMASAMLMTCVRTRLKDGSTSTRMDAQKRNWIRTATACPICLTNAQPHLPTPSLGLMDAMRLQCVNCSSTIQAGRMRSVNRCSTSQVTKQKAM